MAPRVHKSMFSYNITQPYPYRWFSWVVFVGGAVAIALLSVINVAATGYEQSLVHTSQPNKTEHPTQPPWYEKRPWSWVNKIRRTNVFGSNSITCQDQQINVGTPFYTGSIGLWYQITSLARQNDTNLAMSLSYHDDILRNCSVSTIKITTGDGNLEDLFIQATANVHCYVYDASSLVLLGSIVSVSASADGIRLNDVQGVLVDSFLTHYVYNNIRPGIWWGRKMIKWYSTMLRWQNQNQSTTSTWSIKQNKQDVQNGTGSLDFQIGPSDESWSFRGQSVPLQNWTSTFGVDSMQLGEVTTRNNDSILMSGLSNNATIDLEKMPVSVLIDGLAKSFYSTILTDLGQNVSLNIFSRPQRVLRLVNATLQYERLLGSSYYCEHQIGFPCDLTLDASGHLENGTTIWEQTGSGVPAVWATSIFANYLCQIPKLKSTGSLLVAVFVADLVFLRVLWGLLNLSTSLLLRRQHRDTNTYTEHDGSFLLATRRPESSISPDLDNNYEPVVEHSILKPQLSFTTSPYLVPNDDDWHSGDIAGIKTSTREEHPTGADEEVRARLVHSRSDNTA